MPPHVIWSRSAQGKRIRWLVSDLEKHAEQFRVRKIRLRDIRELDEDVWFSDGTAPTCRVIAEHVRRIQHARLERPILIGPDGRLLDGMHRVVRALLEGVDELPAVVLQELPSPVESTS